MAYSAGSFCSSAGIWRISSSTRILSIFKATHSDNLRLVMFHDRAFALTAITKDSFCFVEMGETGMCAECVEYNVLICAAEIASRSGMLRIHIPHNF
eukprot:symbB.v1.2.026945.t1/scaffold2688.1/size72987/6